MASPSSIITYGLGSFGSPSDVVLLGYGSGVVLPGNPPPSVRLYSIGRESRRREIDNENRIVRVPRSQRRTEQ